jgi:hypothetical protein
MSTATQPQTKTGFGIKPVMVKAAYGKQLLPGDFFMLHVEGTIYKVTQHDSRRYRVYYSETPGSVKDKSGNYLTVKYTDLVYLVTEIAGPAYGKRGKQ